MMGSGTTIGLVDIIGMNQYIGRIIITMRNKKFLALTLAFCTACSGTVSVGASAADAGIVGQQTEFTEFIAETGEDGQPAEDALPGTAISENEGNTPAISDEPGAGTPGGDISGYSGTPTEAGTHTETPNKEEQAGAQEVTAQCWDLGDAPRYRLKKAEDSEEYFTAADGLVQVTGNGSNAFYAFDEEGIMQTGSYTLTGKDQGTYYFRTAEETENEAGGAVPNPLNSSIGQMVSKEGWVQDGDKWLYLQNGGAWDASRIGLQEISGETYFLTEDGTMFKDGWKDIDGTSRYFDSQGRMTVAQNNGFIDENGYKFYVDDDGTRVTGLKKIDGAYYYFREEAEDGAPVGSAYKGWKKIGDYWYRFKKNYQAETGSLVTISSKYYFFNQNGRMYKGGLKQIDGKYYYFEKQTATARKGFAVTKKWVKKSGDWYYATANASMKTNGWLKDKGNYYYFGEDSKMVKNKWMQRNGKWGYLKGNGVFSQDWVKIDGEWKYAKKDGTFATGWMYVKRNGAKYRFYFNKKGVLVQDLRKRVPGPYLVKVDRKRNQVTIYGKDSSGKYNTPVVAFPCSVGLPATPTPVGTFTGTRAGRWQELMGPSYGQYATLVEASMGIFIHSVASPAPNINNLPYGEWNKLGRSAASHGCIRVAVADAKWIYQNCNGSTVEIRDYANDGPLDHKKYPKITSAYKWDPTDPEGRGYL